MPRWMGLRHATGSPILTLPRFRKDGTLARMGLGFAEHRHFLVMRSTVDTDKFVPRSDARLWACHAPMVTGCRCLAQGSSISNASAWV